MHPKNVQSIFINGTTPDYLLFKTAIYFAESGLNVWYISQEKIQEVPEKIEPPDKEILKLLTFLYLKDDTELINHLNLAHTWHKSPNVMILSNFEKYCDNSVKAAFLASVSLNAMSACAMKRNTNTNLIISGDYTTENQANTLKSLSYLYFPNIIHVDDKRSEEIFHVIIERLNETQVNR